MPWANEWARRRRDDAIELLRNLTRRWMQMLTHMTTMICNQDNHVVRYLCSPRIPGIR